MEKVVKEVKPLLLSYVPRHIRFGVCCDVPDIVGVHDVSEVVPVVNEDGDTVFEKTVLKSVSAVENMAKFKASELRLSKLQRNGVPLRMVNVNNSSAFRIEELLGVCQSVESAENYVKMLDDQKKQRESWFTEPSVEYSDNLTDNVENQ